MKTAVIIGATGLVGKQLCEGLAAQKEYAQVLAVVRKPVVWQNAKIKNISFDFQNWSDLQVQVKNFAGMAPIDAFCGLGTTINKAGSEDAFRKIDHDYCVEFAKTCQAMGALQLGVVSALGSNAQSEVFYNRVKGEMEADVRKAFFSRLFFVRPSLLLGDREEFRLGEKIAVIVAPFLSLALVGPLKKYKPIHAKQVAQAMITIAQTSSLNQLYFENDFLFDL